MTLADWLVKNHYRESTRRATQQALRAAQAAFDAGQPLPKSTLDGVTRVFTYATRFDEKNGVHVYNGHAKDVTPEFVDWLKDHGVGGVKSLPKEGPKQRVRKAVSLDERRWFRLQDMLETGKEPEDRVIFVVYRTGLRIGDVLRTPITRIEDGLRAGVLDIERKGGYFIKVAIGDNDVAWRALYKDAKKRGSSNVAHYLCRDNDSPLPGDCAYQRANRRIKYYQAVLKCSDSLHLHRLRRTLAVAALKETNGDLVKVQQMLGQTAISSTQRYTDELQVEGVANLQSRIFSRKKKD